MSGKNSVITDLVARLNVANETEYFRASHDDIVEQAMSRGRQFWVFLGVGFTAAALIVVLALEGSFPL